MYLFLKNVLKRNDSLYKIYRFLGGKFLRILRIFIKTDDNLILFVVYGGQRYDDSPKAVYKYMKNNKKYKKYKYVWAFCDPDSIYDIQKQEKVKIDTLKYFILALKAKYWITNSSASRGLNFRKKENINIFFTHGMTGIKKIGQDLNKDNKSFCSDSDKFDYIIIEGKKEEPIIKRAWNLTDEKILNIGLPRNDELVSKKAEEIELLKDKIGVPKNKKVILYAPTFREYKRDSLLATYLKPPFDFELWEKKLGEEYILLLTAHYEVEKLLDVPENNKFIINAFKYPYINDLMLVSDMLISDYSSIIWDYSILGKPIISYAYDFEEYQKERGVYPGYENIFSHGIMKNQNQIIEFIKNIDYKAECEYTKINIRDKYISGYGDVAKYAVDIIFEGCES